MWTNGGYGGGQSPCCSLLICSLGCYLGPHTKDVSKRQHGEHCIRFVSVHSPLTESHQALHLQTPAHTFFLCLGHIISTLCFKLSLRRALAQPSCYFKHFEDSVPSACKANLVLLSRVGVRAASCMRDSASCRRWAASNLFLSLQRSQAGSNVLP